MRRKAAASYLKLCSKAAAVVTAAADYGICLAAAIFEIDSTTAHALHISLLHGSLHLLQWLSLKPSCFSFSRGSVSRKFVTRRSFAPLCLASCSLSVSLTNALNDFTECGHCAN